MMFLCLFLCGSHLVSVWFSDIKSFLLADGEMFWDVLYIFQLISGYLSGIFRGRFSWSL